MSSHQSAPEAPVISPGFRTPRRARVFYAHHPNVESGWVMLDDNAWVHFYPDGMRDQWQSLPPHAVDSIDWEKVDALAF